MFSPENQKNRGGGEILWHSILRDAYSVLSCILGWVNFAEFEITVCGIAKCKKKLKLPFKIFFKFNCFAKILNHFSTPPT